MVPRLALFVLGAVPAVAMADANIVNSLLRGSAPELAQATGSRFGSMTRGLGGEDRKGGSYDHVGCFLDDKEDRILGSKFVSSSMTTMECHTHCDGMAAAYMATQYGSECWCSKEGMLDYERHGDKASRVGKCDLYCNGDSRETCGGRDAFDLYRMEWAPASSSPEYKGCYRDMKDARLMDDLMRDDLMTPDLCRKHCMGKGVKTYATQYGNECWCGNSDRMSDYTTHGEGVCHMRCSGDEAIACGGYNALSVFQMDAMTSGSPTPAPSEMVEETDKFSPEATAGPTAGPTPGPTAADDQPTTAPSMAPSAAPSAERRVTLEPTMAPSAERRVTSEPTMAPSAERRVTLEPTMAPSAERRVTLEPTMAPSAEPTAEPTEAVSGDGGGGGGGGGNAGDYAEMLAIHNEKRCMHNADPLTWDDNIFKVAKDYAEFLTNSKNCGDIFHSDNQYGENLYYCGSTGGYGCYSDEKAMTALFDDELVDKNNVETYGGHATAIAWKSTERLGCAVSTCESGGYFYHTLVCNFDPPGNYNNRLKEEVEPPTKSEAQCSR